MRVEMSNGNDRLTSEVLVVRNVLNVLVDISVRRAKKTRGHTKEPAEGFLRLCHLSHREQSRLRLVRFMDAKGEDRY